MGLAHGDTLRQVGVSVSRATVSRRACNRPVALHHNLVLVTPQPVFTQGHDCGAKRPREATPSPAREGARLAHSKSRARQRPAGPGVASAGRPRRTRAGGPSGSVFLRLLRHSPAKPSREPPPRAACSPAPGACVGGAAGTSRLPSGSSFPLDEPASLLFQAMEFCPAPLDPQSQRDPRPQMPLHSV